MFVPVSRMLMNFHLRDLEIEMPLQLRSEGGLVCPSEFSSRGIRCHPPPELASRAGGSIRCCGRERDGSSFAGLSWRCRDVIGTAQMKLKTGPAVHKMEFLWTLTHPLNMLLGRPWLHDVRAVPQRWHLKRDNPILLINNSENPSLRYAILTRRENLETKIPKLGNYPHHNSLAKNRN